MKAKTQNKKTWSTIRVEHWGRDSWSGPELIERKEFKNITEALEFCKKINSKNVSPFAPEYYEEAHIVD